MAGFARQLSSTPQLENRLVWAPRRLCGIQKLALAVGGTAGVGSLMGLEKRADDKYYPTDPKSLGEDWVLAQNGMFL